MNTWIEALVALFLLLGSLFALVGAIGLYRLPDFFMRLHGPTKATTLGVGGVILASMIFFSSQEPGLSVHELLITLFLFITALINRNGSYVLTVALLMPISGFVADKFGTKRVFIFALGLFALGSLFCSLSQNLTQLVLSRVLQGIGGSLMTPVGRLTLIKTYPKNELVQAMNYAIVPALIGPVLGPLVGGYMVDYLSWHWIFLINLPIALIGIVLSLRFLPNFQSKALDFDLKGFLIFAGASLLLSISLEFLGSSVQLTLILAALAMGFLLLFFYFRHAKNNF